MEVLNEVLLCISTQNMDTSGYHRMSDLESTEFHWEDHDLNMIAICRPTLDTPFCPSTSNDHEIG